jgi:fluoride exporter
MTGAAGTIVTTCLIAVSGGVGAALRLAVNGAIHRRVRPNYPVAMSIINVSGSFVLGLVAGLAGGHVISEQWSMFIGIGLVGGFTAFSATSFQTLRLLQERRVWLALANSFGMIAVAIAAAGLGIWLGRALDAIAASVPG